MEQVTYADAGQQGGAGDDEMEIEGEQGGAPSAKRVHDLQAEIAGLMASIKSYGDRIERLIASKETVTDAEIRKDINNDITKLEAQQAKLEAQQVELKAQQTELESQLGSGAGGPSSAARESTRFPALGHPELTTTPQRRPSATSPRTRLPRS